MADVDPDAHHGVSAAPLFFRRSGGMRFNKNSGNFPAQHQHIVGPLDLSVHASHFRRSFRDRESGEERESAPAFAWHARTQQDRKP